MSDQGVSDVISGLASAEANRVRKFRDSDEEELDRVADGLPVVPLLHIVRGSVGKWSVCSSGEQGHPNEARMPVIKQWLERDVFPLAIDSEDLSGTYRLELHDSYTYLPRADEYRDILSFCRSSTTNARVALLPDPYQACGYSGLLGAVDDVPWKSKRPTVMFAGSTTGAHDPKQNKRVMACIWALDHKLETDFRISAVVQMRPYDIIRRIPVIRDIIAPHVSPQVQFQYRFLANIVGNTACWSRVPMIMRSSSVMFHTPHDDIAWYYPMMQAGVHYVECASHDSFLQNRLTCMADDAGCQLMTGNANALYNSYLTRAAAASYTLCLLFDIRGK